MKKCSYCGHDNADEARNCSDCGTELGMLPEPRKTEATETPTTPTTATSTKRLANVLIKVMGLWVCLQAIPPFVSGFLRGLLAGLHGSGATRAATAPDYSWTYAAGSAVYFFVGLFLILGSRYVAGVLFKDED